MEYLVRFLHQTTTTISYQRTLVSCISSVSYIKPQPCTILIFSITSCISSVSYIKPQHPEVNAFGGWCCISSVSYIKPQQDIPKRFSICVVYRPFPTSNHNHLLLTLYANKVVYRPFPTSNHNLSCAWTDNQMLYIVRFLHQTTTLVYACKGNICCISSVSYIKPQHRIAGLLPAGSCISSVSYIKPQRFLRFVFLR